MTFKELISKINLNLFVKSKIILKKIMPLLEEEYIAIDILDTFEEANVEYENDYIDLELGNGFKLINEAKLLYFYNKV